MAANSGCKRNAAGFNDQHQILIIVVHDAEELPTFIDSQPQSEVQVGPDKLEVVASFCYLGVMLSAGRSCELTVVLV